VSIVYDAGVLVAADRNDRRIWADHRARLELGVVPTTTAPVAAQVSRSAAQSQLRRLLRGCEVVPFSADAAHDVGLLLAKAELSDVVDAHVVVVASRSRSVVVTSDPGDLRQLSAALEPPVEVIPI
jgi:predicted nucleic acid-binding protein